MGLEFYDDFLGEHSSEVTLQFSGADFEGKFRENLEKLPADWYYRTVPVYYYHNKLGHRSKNPELIDFDNYILFSGCSHTYGVGLENEKTYAYLSAKKLNCDYYNLGLGGTGIDVMFYNVMTWLEKFPKPKFVFLQWTDWTRYLGYIEKTMFNQTSIQPEGHWSVNKNASRVTVIGNEIGYFFSRAMLYHNLIKNKLASLNIPYHYISFLGPDTIKLPETFIFKTPPDKARDNSHFGIETNEIFSDMVVEKYHEILR